MLRSICVCIHLPLWRLAARAAMLLLVAGGCACAQSAPPDPPPHQGLADTSALLALHTREFIFVGKRRGAPLVAEFRFDAAAQGDILRRTARAALAVGAEWETFFDENWRSPAATGVWRVLPYGDLRVIAGGAAEVEALVFRRGERELRLVPGSHISTFNPRDDLQYRFSTGLLEQAGHTHDGSVVETFQVQWRRADEPEFAGALDWSVLTDGNQLHLLVAESQGAPGSASHSYAWALLPGAGERSWDLAQVRWLEVRTVEPARRDVPVQWSFEIPGAGLTGEMVSVGSALELGPERPGRRAVKLRHTVEGWVRVGDELHHVFGLVRHVQN